MFELLCEKPINLKCAHSNAEGVLCLVRHCTQCQNDVIPPYRPFVGMTLVVTVTDCVGDVPHQPVSQEGGNVHRSPRALRPQLGLGAVTRQPAAKTRVQQAGQRPALVPSPSAPAAGASTHDAAGEMAIRRHKSLILL